jgi:hypothetical protein
MHVLEINTLIDHLKISTTKSTLLSGDYDAHKKVLKSKNEVFENQKAIEEYFEERKVYGNDMMEVKMDKTFNLTQNYKEGTKLVIDLGSKLLHKLKFKVNHEGITEAKIISMPNKVLVTCSLSYITRIWSLLGLNLCILNLEYPLPYKWELKINRFYQRKHKYIEAMRMKKLIDEKWYDLRKSSTNDDHKLPFFDRDPLEMNANLKTFKHLVAENKDDPLGLSPLRKIDAHRKSNLEEEKKSSNGNRFEMVQGSNHYTIKRPDGGRDDMARNHNGAPITGKMPEYIIRNEGPEIDENIVITRVDENAHNHGTKEK